LEGGEGREEVQIRFWWENLREGDDLKNLDLDGTIILKKFDKLDGWE
jgi:hypothetical protein